MKLLDLVIGTVLLAALAAGGWTLHDAGYRQGHAAGYQEGAATRKGDRTQQRLKDLEVQVQVLGAEVAEHRSRVGKIEALHHSPLSREDKP